LLEAIRHEDSTARFFQASSSEMFGTNPDVPSNEHSDFRPGVALYGSKGVRVLDDR
jgi:GDP-D-mannose dehydratase